MSQNYTWPSGVEVTVTPSGTQDVNLTEVGGAPITEGQKTMANSIPVVIASDQSAIPVTFVPSGTQNINVTQYGGVATTLGQKASTASIPVVIASDDTVAISAAALPLPAGASTSALQTTGNTSLSTIASNQTNGTQVTTVSNFPATQPVSGTVTVVQPTGTNLHAVLDATSTTAVTQATASALNATVVQATGTNLHTVVDSGSISVSNFPATQPVSGTVTVVQPTGTNLHAVLDATSTTAVTQATAANLNATVVGSGNFTVVQPTGTNLHTTVDNFPATQPVSGTVAVTQSTTPWADNISQYGGVSTSLGQKVSASSIPVVIASDNTVAISAASLPLPTGAATSANQTNGTQKSQISTPTALTVTQAAITVGTTAVRLTVSGSAPSATRVVLAVTPDVASAATFYIGSATVTNSGATRGIEIKAGQSFIANNDAGDYYIVASTAAQTVTVMEQA